MLASALVVHVSIAVLTYRRNDEVRALVPQLLDQIRALPEEASPSTSVEVLVVDNDPAGGARDTLSPFLGRQPVVRYVHESTPGIAPARNRALDEAAADGLVIFIDDDERPTEHWLSQMLTAWREHGSAAVGGPVVARLDDDVDPWVLAGGFFDRAFRSEFRTGQSVDTAPTGNLLLDMTRVNHHRLRFDATLGLAGGEDTVFTRQLVGHGEQIIWCDEAEVLDRVPPERLTRRWLVRRVFMVANASTHASLRLAVGPIARLRVRARYLGTGLARLMIGAVRVVAGTLGRAQRTQAAGVAMTARGAGAASAAIGLRYEEYAR